jgi:CRP-like cAMP-binding protein
MVRLNNGQVKEETIDSNLLILWGGVFKNYDKDEYVFKEGQCPNFYHQVIEGKIKMVNEEEKEERDFIQGFFSDGESFGEPPAITGQRYPASAIAVQPSVVIRLNIPSFIRLLKENFDAHLKITKSLARRVEKKTTSLKEISLHSPEHRILTLLNILKKEKSDGDNRGKIRIEYTRRDIASMTGLRVETVIRVMRNLQDKKMLLIEKGKVFY